MLLAPENIGPQGFAFLEETLPQDAFQASEEILAGYGMFDLPIVRDRLRFVAGVRMEYSYITVDTFDQSSGLPTTLIKNNLDPLPGANLIYTPRADMNIRLGYSRSVSRPEFRELSPAVFPAPKGLRPVVGDPTLVQSDIESYDLRWEWFFSPSELVSVSGFYKSIEKPIEQVVISQGGSGADSFANADTASLEGFEFEGRKNFGFLSAALADVNVVTNVAYVHSSVDVPRGGLAQVQTSTNRPLQGQAPFVVNTSLEYAHPTLGTARLLYNTAGRRITSAGAFGLPDIYEERRDQLDLVLISRIAPLGTPMNVKFAIENILNDNVEFTQGGLIQRDYDPGGQILHRTFVHLLMKKGGPMHNRTIMMNIALLFALFAIALGGCGDDDTDIVFQNCGNGVIDSGEACDDGNVSDSDACLSTCVVATCGDGFVNAGTEACDGSNLGGASCTTLGLGSGSLQCSSSCTFNTSGCGNGATPTPGPVATSTPVDGATATPASGDTPTPAPTSTPGGGPLCGASDTITVAMSINAGGLMLTGVNANISYPSSANIPGSIDEQSVKDRVTFTPSGGLTVVNDDDTNGDLVDDLLTLSFVSTSPFPDGPFATVQFDCLPGSPAPASGAFTCDVVSASDDTGQDPNATCALVVTGP